MAYFLRFTATPNEDMERGSSLHIIGDASFAEGVEDAEYINEAIGWAVVLNGLCAHSLDAETEEEAIEEAVNSVLWARENSGASGNYPEGDGYAAYLFSGIEGGDCEDGTLFTPKSLIVNISLLADNSQS